MAGICSAHRDIDPNCPMCKTHPRDIFPNWDEKVKEAEAAGTHICECGFEYYLTVNSCPLCERKYEGRRPT